jgi:hypothetical protein
MEIGKHGTQIQGLVVYTIAVLLFKNSVKPIDAMECAFVSGQ